MNKKASNDYLVLDIEASGLHQYSFPIEIAWCGPNVLAKSFYIKPDKSWRIFNWSDDAQRLHGISLEAVIKQGRMPKEIVDALRLDGSEKTILSDGVSFDQNWMNMICVAVEAESVLVLTDVYSWLGQKFKTRPQLIENVLAKFNAHERRIGPKHRALDDVAALNKMITECINLLG
jgi:DNA polymerase III epsilon subunit-like protein